MDLLLRGEGSGVAVTGGVGVEKFPSFSEISIDLIFSVVSSRPGISSADDLYLFEFIRLCPSLPHLSSPVDNFAEPNHLSKKDTNPSDC
jgi:hypothetical protein